MKLIVGLGNPGDRYKNTRHNVGFAVVDAIAEKLAPEQNWRTGSLSHANILSFKYGDEHFILAKPLTFMNNSGLAVSSLAGKYKVSSQDITVIHDELDLPLGTIKVAESGSSAGNNGVQNIIDTLKTQEFKRIRCGIGKPEMTDIPKEVRRSIVSNHVLTPFTEEEKPAASEMIESAISAILH